MIKAYVKPMWVVYHRGVLNDGGLWNFPCEVIVFDKLKDAKREAEKIFKQYKKDPIPYVGLAKILMTYTKNGVAISKGNTDKGGKG